VQKDRIGTWEVSGLHAMARARLVELALPIVIYLAMTLAVFALALWLLPL
jgi:hypothetical protein